MKVVDTFSESLNQLGRSLRGRIDLFLQRCDYCIPPVTRPLLVQLLCSYLFLVHPNAQRYWIARFDPELFMYKGIHVYSCTVCIGVLFQWVSIVLVE